MFLLHRACLTSGFFPTAAALVFLLAYKAANAGDDAHPGPAKAAEMIVPPLKVIKDLPPPPPKEPKPLETKDGKPVATATPQEVAARIAERVAKMRTEKNAKPAKELAVQKRAPIRKQPVAANAAPAPAPQTGPAARKDVHWSYGGEGGPLRWAEMNPEWAACGTGNRQSPIDIRSGIKVDLEPIGFDYKSTGFTIVDNGHTIQVNLGPGNFITVSNRMYELVQFHFHRPSEEKINGRAYDMVAHLVHKDAAGKLAVVAVLIERGAARTLVQTIWNNLPLEKNDTVTPPGAIDMIGILPSKREYYTYMGSLTTPPCSEGVLWLVMREPVSISQNQIDIFARLYQMNARPIQGTGERLIKESN